MSPLASEAGEARALRWRLFWATFSILALELAVIRWMSHQVRLFAYLNNVLLIGCFLGMGLGVMVGRRRPGLVHATLPALAVLAAVLAGAPGIGLTHLGFPDAAVSMWSAPAHSFLGSLLVIMGLFLLPVAVFVCAGSVVGDLFGRLDPLRAYAWDLAGSMAGIATFTALAAFLSTPLAWLAVAALPLLWFSRRFLSLVSYLAVVALAAYSVQGARFSPYYRIDVERAEWAPGRPLELSVNRDFHQYMHDLSDRNLESGALSARERSQLEHAQAAYGLPFRLARRKASALILGAGTGNDVAAALREGFARVVAVDIDPVILRLGAELHPERPYQNPGVTVVVNDARAYLEQNRAARFDVVCFGLLDSHAMFSTLSSLRLDNYVYTAESLRSAWRLVEPGGVLSLSFAVSGKEWLSERLYGLMAEATGAEPLVVYHGVEGGYSYMASKGGSLDLNDLGQPKYSPGKDIQAVAAHHLPVRVRLTTDDWPFLYLQPGAVPYGYLAVIGLILAIAVVGTRAAARVGGSGRHFDAPLFLLGAAFLLIETRGVTDMSLLFGSTWIVNSFVFFGILATAWVANEIARRRPGIPLAWVFGFLVLTLLVNYVVHPSALLNLPLVARGLLGGLLNALPVVSAGLVFSSLLRNSTHPDTALGSNLLGAVAGGCLEYLSMVTGLRALTLLALALYLGVGLLLLRSASRPAAS